MSTHKPAEPKPDGAPASGPPAQPFLVVGVGASAGGLEAFTELLANVPAGAGITFLFVQHLEPNQPSLLLDLLRNATRLTVRQAEQDLPLEPEHLYVIPRDADMAVKGDRLVLVPRRGTRGLHMPVDHLFRSLAEDQHSRAVGVVLSGGGTDGTLGLQAIKEEGGITFAQDERTARQHSMPRSAAAEGVADYVLPPAEIAGRLLRVAQHPYTSEPEPADGSAIDKVINLLRASTGVDFAQYKRSTIGRRIRRRMALRSLEDADAYVRVLEEEPGELRDLHQDCLIRVTRFFRDEEVFAALKAEVFPALVKERSPNAPVRVWVAGCSTGEEVYSLAIALMEYLGDRHSNLPLKILATDVNEAALEKARAGVYVDNIELDVAPERLQRFFAKVNGHYQVGKVIRDLCVFSKHNLGSDPPFSRLDLVSCRNVLIYLDAPLQKRVLPILHYALNPGGFLVLGSSETVGGFSDLFAAVDARHRIYVRSAAGSLGPLLDFGGLGEPPGSARRLPAGGALPWSALDVQKEADRIVLARYAPVGVVIDENMTVLQFRGRTGPYLEPAPGMASLDLLKMLRDGLLGEVRAAVNRARTENVPVRKEGIPLREEDHVRPVTVEVIPAKVPPSGVRCFVVLFHDSPRPDGAAAADPAESAAARPPAGDQQVQQLQQELAATRDYLQSLVEEHEAASEELKSASEELMSSNEELQSTNEELQTAKEETQSANEELSTLNEELHHRNLALAQANNDLVNLLAAVNLTLVLVSRDLRIRRFTPVAEKVLNLIPTDVGRPISDINPKVNVPDLADRIARVIDTLTPEDAEIQDREGRWYALRIRPYVTLDNKIDGASIALIDIDSLKRGLEQKSGGT